MTEQQCDFCGGSLTKENREFERDVTWYACPICGRYALTEEAGNRVKPLNQVQRATVAAYFRARSIRSLLAPLVVSQRSNEGNFKKGEFTIGLDRILEEHPLPRMEQRMDRALLNLALRSEFPGHPVDISTFDFSLLVSENELAAMFLLQQMHIKHFIVENHDTLPTKVTLSADGWNRVAELRRGEHSASLRQAFVAMWFEPDMDKPFSEGIAPAIEEAGFTPLRIDFKEHNNQVTDEIVAEIKRSRFLVADFTGHRPGVYYEAGLMYGLGRPVIFTCRKDDLPKAHFDTRQYSHIVWETPTDLRQKLLRRIQATIID